MEAKELRVGNQLIDYTAEPPLVFTLNLENWVKIASFNYEDILPLPVTEEWLLNAGFELIGPKYYTCKGYHYTEIKEVNVTCTDGKKQRIAKDINHAHQVQNLWYALTGEDLVIKKPGQEYSLSK